MSADPFYRSKQWAALRAACLRRDPTCTTPGCREASTVADHIIERAKGGPDALGNLRGLCAPCHGQRSRGRATPYAKGALADGSPLDPRHWWNA